ncbi:glycosyltransferase family 2 protein [Clostridiales bacterium COT073_COT-073]|nr:glycosyltransferase family 2 protein [Clostridiales bacterium COT073_COT-073]
MNTIQVIMSTYNGEKFLTEQLDSILTQEMVKVDILVRDDGSVDDTLAILEEYQKKYTNFRYFAGQNCGVIQSFFEAMKYSEEEAEYYAFADQDDVWLPQKLQIAIERLKEIRFDLPALYCSKTILVDEELNELPMQINEREKIPSFGNALVENICTGCTAVMNKALFKKIKEHVPEYTVMHDWWFYLTASYFGEVIYDEEGYILYRQHGHNVLGSRNTYLKEFKARAKNFKKHRGQVRKQAISFYKSYKEELLINPQARRLLAQLLNAKKNWRYKWALIKNSNIYRQRPMDNLIFKILYLANHI